MPVPQLLSGFAGGQRQEAPSADRELLLEALPPLHAAEPAGSARTARLLRRGGACAPRRLATGLGTAAACLAGVALLALARRRSADGAAAAAARLEASVSLASGSCTDTPGWANGFLACKQELLGNNPAYCGDHGWTCQGYVAKGLCGGPEGPKAFAMGPGLNSPEKNCCACQGFKLKASCDKDTGGTCHLGTCSGWRGAAACEGGRCLCKPGYCHGGAGTCQLDSRSAYIHRGSNTTEAPPPQCTSDTGGTCSMFGKCDGYRGAVSCQMGMPPRCICADGHCASPGGICFPNRGNVIAKVAPVSRTHPVFPGQQGQIVTAWCVSGGGGRSMSAALGQYRALVRLGLLQNVDVISSVSGGSWASSILMFAPMDLKALLGLNRSLAPSALTLDELDKTPPPFGAVLTKPTVKAALALRMKKVPYRLLWIETIGQTFLEPFGLYSMSAYMAPNQTAVQDIKARNPKFQDAVFHTPQEGRAKNLIMNGCVTAPDGFKASADNVISFQAGPDFTGSPFYPNDTTVDYENSELGRPGLTHVLAGGGLVETFAFGSSHPAKRSEQFGGDSVGLIAPAEPFSLVKAVGISSAAFAGQASNLVAAGQNVNPQLPLWPVTSPEHPRPQVAMQHQLGDGGNLENTGVLAVLQRNASKIAAMINSDTGLGTTINFCSPLPNQDPKGQITSQFAQLFGYCKEATSMVYSTHNQVFKQEDFWPIACQFQRLKNAGKAQVVGANLAVQPNAWWGIAGGRTVAIVFSLLDKASEFEGQLPQDTRSALQFGPAGGFSNFPNYRTTFQNINDLTQLTPRQINLLAAQADWAVMQNASTFQALLAAPFR